MTPKIEIDLSNVITAKDQMQIGMHLWSVGAGGTSAPRKPYYAGQLIGFGNADYAFTPGHETATGFAITDTDIGEFAVVATGRMGEMQTCVIPEGGYAKNTVHALADLSEDPVHVSAISFLPQSYNNWYVCDSEEKALAVFEEMKAKWTEEHEEARVEYQQRMDEWDSAADYYMMD